MSLDPMPDAATLLRMKAEREGRSRTATFAQRVEPAYSNVTTSAGEVSTILAVVQVSEWLAPVRLRIPWSALISDNIKHTTDKATGKRYCMTEYREARKRIRALATEVMQGRPAAECPLALVGRIWLPNNRRHDAHNYGKCLLDSLTGVVFTDDSWVYDTRWIRAGVDVDAPRAEIQISPLTPTE